jgi:uncharacterized membrane protein
MNETGLSTIEAKTATDRTVMHLLYAMHTFTWVSVGFFTVIAVVVNYIKRSDEVNPLYASHHSYMISTVWWTVLWLIVTSPLYLLFLLPGMIAHGLVGLWYLYRCIRGWLRFVEGRAPGAETVRIAP